MANRLANETSPYLKQHQDNPVDWYPWGDEALRRAKDENKPILLSVGYSACHWCHVMAHESFEDAETARLMNEFFVNIKVDREERPDLDQIYQNVAQVFTRGGGWPLTVFLTPELKPFFGGTYFPPEDKYGRPGFPRVLQALHDAFHNQRDNVNENAQKIMDTIATLETVSPGGARAPAPPRREELEALGAELLGHVDWTHGGVGGAPKFPNPMMFTYLWRLGSLTGAPQAREAAVSALVGMARGGIYDQLGGGFSRYSVDESWSVPHFEKMLYDNGLLLKLYAEVLLTDGLGGAPLLAPAQTKLFLDVLEQSAGYVLREMRAPSGGFYSAQDADSEGEEGKFFGWNPAEVRAALNADEAAAFLLRFGVTEGGNFEHGKTVLYQALTVEEVAARTGAPVDRTAALLEAARAKLFQLRAGRIAPGLDDKILTGWNGLMISGLSWAGAALAAGGRTGAGKAAQDAAREAFAFVRANVASKGPEAGRLSSTFQGGQPRFNGYLDDYAFMAQAALDLARFSPAPAGAAEPLAAADQWLQAILRHFKDPDGSGYFFTSDDHERLIQRPKTIYDQAIPSGTAVALGGMLALAELDVGGHAAQYEAEAGSQLEGLFSAISRNPFGFGELLSVSLLAVAGPVAVSGAGAAEVCRHPHFFQKPGADPRLLVCHRKVCSLPQADAKAALDEALRVGRPA